MYIARVPNRNSPPAFLLREGYREGGKVKTRTLANLTALPTEALEVLRRSLRGDRLVSVSDAFRIVPDGSRPHGHVAAVLLAMKQLGFAELVASRPSRERDLVLAMVAARILEPGSKLSTSRWLATTTLPTELGVGGAGEDELYSAMDWLLERQETIERKLAARHLEEDGLALYDLTSSYFEGVRCPLATLGYNRDGKKGKLQVNYGLLTNRDGVPVSVSVVKGNSGDTQTLLAQVQKTRERFGLQSFVLVGDRGMIMQKQIDVLRGMDGTDWISALSTGAIRKLVQSGALQMSLFDEQSLFEVSAHPDFEGERLVACRNPELARLRAHKRQALLDATAEELRKVQDTIGRGRLRGSEVIRAALEKAVGRKLRPYVSFEVRDDGFAMVVAEERLVADLTRTTRQELEQLHRLTRSGKLKGAEAIGHRVAGVLGRRQVGRHMSVVITSEGFTESTDSAALLAEALAPLQDKLAQLRQRIERGEIYGKANIGVRIGKVINKYKVAKHFILEIREDGFGFHTDTDRIAAEAALDGVYVVRTSLPVERMDAAETVRNYKQLSQVERAFRSFKTIDLKVRPIHHNAERRVRAHIFLCMLAYYVQWHMTEAWRPLLFSDEDQAAKTTRDPVSPARRSDGARAKAASRRLTDGTPVHSFRTLLHMLATLVRNTCRRTDAPDSEPDFEMLTPPNDHQKRAYDLLTTIRL